MSDRFFRMILNLWMAVDSWPLSPDEENNFNIELDKEAKRRGFEDRADAYFRFMVKEEKP